MFLLPLTALAIEVEERDEQTSESIIFGSESSSIPTGGTLHQFRPQTLDVFDHVDASTTPEAYAYVGYGVFDEEEDNCVYIDARPEDGSSVDSAFNEFKTYNGHSYGISRTPMTYGQCQQSAAKYYGYPIMITTEEENGAANVFFRAHSFWTSTQRASCSEPYRDQRGRVQDYFDWPNGSTACEPIKLQVIQSAGSSKWSAVNGTETHHCVVEFESADYEQPVKVCAPWWSVERTYSLPSVDKYLVQSVDENGDVVEIDLRNINQKDFPKNVEVCTKVEPSTGSVDAGTQEVICNSYFDIRRSPRCHDNIKQEVCKVDECRGSIKNTCELIETADAPLPYAKQLVIVDGVEEWVKGKDEIKMHKYRCPVVTKQAGCLQTQTVSMLPQPCPGTDIDENGDPIRPIRVYGSASTPGKYDGGTLVALYGECPDGSRVEVPVDVYRQTNSTCLKYASTDHTKTIDEMCFIERGYIDHTVLTALTTEDVYMDDNSCVRLNNIEESRPKQEIIIDYETYGFANVGVVKARLDGTKVDNSPQHVISRYFQNAIASGEYGFQEFHSATAEEMISSYDLSNIQQIECDDYKDNAYIDHLKDYQDHYVKASYDYPSGNILTFGRITKDLCESRISAVGGTILWGADDTNATEVADYDATYETLYGFSVRGLSSADLIQPISLGMIVDECVAVVPAGAVSGEVFDRLLFGMTGPSASADITMDTSAVVDYLECRRKAACTYSDIQNSSHYGGEQVCVLHKSETSGTAVWAEVEAETAAEIEAQTPPVSVETSDDTLAGASSKGTLPLDSIDGVSDIYAVMEYTDFDWGHFSSYSSRIYRSNKVSINGLQVSPMVPHPVVPEPLYEDYWWDGKSYVGREYGKQVRLAVGIGAGGGVDSYGGSTIASAFLTTGVSSATALVLAAFEPQVKTFEMHNVSEVYNPLDPSLYWYVPNPNPLYETRQKRDNRQGKASVFYAEFEQQTQDGVMRDSQEASYFKTLQIEKLAMYKELNINTNNYEFPPHEKMLPMGYPSKCPWYNVWCTKDREGVIDSWTTLPHPEYHERTLTVHYMGATNSITIVVPYRADYEVKAYDKHDQLISEKIVYETAFTDGVEKMRNAPVDLGTGTITTAPGIQAQRACLSDPMAEVGGGVSGAYYELGSTGTHIGFACDQADFAYTQEHAITRLTVKATNTDQSFTIDLIKPMSYLNRAYLSTLDVSEAREYRCYSAFEDCLDYEASDD